MLSALFLFALQLFGFTLVAAAGKRPSCVQKCWENTQYVSPDCKGSIACLCEDTEYQNAVYQCLYSQCHTAQFANALHHTLAMCSADKAKKHAGGNKALNVPALLRQDNLKKRQNKPMQSNSASVSASARPTQSVSRSVGPTASVTRSAGQQSVSASNYMSRAVKRAIATPAPAPAHL